MSSRAAQVQVLNGRVVARPVEQGPHCKELVEGKLAVINMAAGETVCVLEILRSNDLVMEDHLRQVRSVLGQCLDHSVTERNPLAVPAPALELVRRVLHIDR